MQLPNLLQITPMPAAAGRPPAGSEDACASGAAGDFARELGLATDPLRDSRAPGAPGTPGAAESDAGDPLAPGAAARKGLAALIALRDQPDATRLLPVASVGCRAEPDPGPVAEAVVPALEPDLAASDDDGDTDATASADAGQNLVPPWFELLPGLVTTARGTLAADDAATLAQTALPSATSATAAATSAITAPATAAAKPPSRRGGAEALLGLAEARDTASSRRGERRDRAAGAELAPTANADRADAAATPARAESAPPPDRAETRHQPAAEAAARPALPPSEGTAERRSEEPARGETALTALTAPPATGAAEAMPQPAAAATTTTAPNTSATERAMAQLQLPVPITTPEFMPLFGAELSLLARDGVQEARVHVNPAEMGPIAVQITLEGQQAQVHLHSDSALTRQLLEQSMPALAAALRENGLTLTGGGVFEQPRQQPGSGASGTPGAAPGGRDGDEALDRAAGPARAARHQGVLDVYA